MLLRCIAVLLSWALFCSAQAKSPEQNIPDFRLHVESNLVLVRVVVRDAQGNSVENLKKEDFELFDGSKQQSIVQFEIDTSIPHIPSPGADADPKESTRASPSGSSAGTRFVALYFDDLHTSDADMIEARDSGNQYLTANLQNTDRVAILTSEMMLSDFTADPKQIREALAKLRVSSRALTRIRECPDLSDYQALQISQVDDITTDAWKTAIDEAISRCGIADTGIRECLGTGTCPSNNPGVEALMDVIRSHARSILAQADLQTRNIIAELERLINDISQMPGQRTIILVSPGFLSESERSRLDKVIDQALRKQVVVNSLDPRGLALLMREADITRGYAPSANSGVITSTHNVDFDREARVTDVLTELTEGTGGEFFHNNNDLKTGFKALVGSPSSYLLAFSPQNLKTDGKFHPIRVRLVRKHKGFVIHARRGYFAPQSKALAEAQLTNRESSEVELMTQEQIREAIFSDTQSRDLPVVLGAQVVESQGNMRDLNLVSHLDAKLLSFYKRMNRNQNNVVFAFGVFDEKHQLISLQQQRTVIDVPDARLQELKEAGVNVRVTFKLKSGIYVLREVVLDSKDHHLTALSRTVHVR